MTEPSQAAEPSLIEARLAAAQASNAQLEQIQDYARRDIGTLTFNFNRAQERIAALEAEVTELRRQLTAAAAPVVSMAGSPNGASAAPRPPAAAAPAAPAAPAASAPPDAAVATPTP